MPKEQFFHKETDGLLKLLDEAAYRAGTSRGHAFSDFLEMAVCALSGGAMEDQYLTVVQRYAAGEQGRRGIDSITMLFANLARIMEETRADILGDLFQGAITYGEAGQYLTPESLTDLMAQLVAHDDTTPAERVCDPCCGSGRLLLSAAKVNPRRLFVGQDVDIRCVRMTAINLGLHNLYGYVIWGNTLALEQKLVYQTGFNGTGVIRELPPPSPPAAQQTPEALPPAPPSDPGDAPPRPPGPSTAFQQRDLFDMD